MIQTRTFTVGCCLMLLMSLAGQAHATVDLGKISHYRLMSYAQYFEPYFQWDEPYFPDAEQKTKVIRESQNVYAWLREKTNWPASEKVTATMYINAAKLSHYFAKLKFEGAEASALGYIREAELKDPQNFEVQMEKMLILASMKGTSPYKTALAAERALETNSSGAAKGHAHYIASRAFYRAGYFKKSYEHLLKQAEIDPDYENVTDLLFVYNSRIEGWGKVPERIAFKVDEDGELSPSLD